MTNTKPGVQPAEPPILVSALKLGTYSLAGEPRSIVCPGCQTWRRVRKGVIFPHDDANGATCAASRRRCWFDLDPQQEAAARFALELAGREAAERRGTRVQLKAKPTIPAPVAHLNRDRAPRRAQIAGWTTVDVDYRRQAFATANTHRGA